MKLNLPNKLTLVRILMVPLVMVFIAFDLGLPEIVARLLAAAFFGIASFTDFVDGHIARKYNLITNFGKFMDPLADKLLVFIALISLCYATGRQTETPAYGICMLIATCIVIFRELAVTSMRLVVNNAEGVVIAANSLGKIKTCVQIAFILTAIIEPLFHYDFAGGHLVAYILMAAMSVMTVWSGIVYFKSYWKFINPDN